MLSSRLYSPTLREIPADAVVVSHQYMLKAGMMRKVASGFYAFLPLAFRSIQKVENIIRQEMAKVGSQEMLIRRVSRPGTEGGAMPRPSERAMPGRRPLRGTSMR